jgi:hypothetical protein
MSFRVSNTTVDKVRMAPTSKVPIFNSNQLYDVPLSSDTPVNGDIFVYDSTLGEYVLREYSGVSDDVLKESTVVSYVCDGTQYGREIKNTLIHAQQAKIQGLDTIASDNFGNSVSISADGQYAICGALAHYAGGTNAGVAYIFIRSGTTWTQQQKIQGLDTTTSDRFGNSVSISADGQYVICGANLQDTGGTNAGAAYIFIRSGTTWTQQQKIQGLDTIAGDNFGNSVSISADGQYVICGASGYSGGSNAGAAYIFTRSGAVWDTGYKIQGSDTIASDNFGRSVSISADGQHAIVGANRQDTGGVDAGAAYIFTRSGTVWTQQKIQGSDTIADDSFGYSVSISADGQYAICGAYLQDTGGVDAGAAYIFKTDNYIPLKTTGVIVDSTTAITKTLSLFDNSLIKTGNTSNGGYTITLPPNMVDGRIINVFMTFADATGVSFSPAVLGHTNPTNLGANGAIQIMYVASMNNWYKI